MWNIVRGQRRKHYVKLAAELMKNTERFLKAMRSALIDWPNSCENSFSADAVNHLAFLGHAGCCIAVNSPEECTRVAWHTLTPSEQAEANRAARIVVGEWAGVRQLQGDLFDA